MSLWRQLRAGPGDPDPEATESNLLKLHALIRQIDRTGLVRQVREGLAWKMASRDCGEAERLVLLARLEAIDLLVSQAYAATLDLETRQGGDPDAGTEQ